MGTALVTGASSGLGEEFCWQLAAARHNLVLVARREDKLREIAEKIEAASGVHTEVLVADLGTARGRKAVVERLRQDERPIGLLVNNAGFGLGVPFRENSMTAETKALDVMVRAVMELTHAAVNAVTVRF